MNSNLVRVIWNDRKIFKIVCASWSTATMLVAQTCPTCVINASLRARAFIYILYRFHIGVAPRRRIYMTKSNESNPLIRKL